MHSDEGGGNYGEFPTTFIDFIVNDGRVRLARFARVSLLRPTLPISLLILRKKPTVLQSSVNKEAENSFY